MADACSATVLHCLWRLLWRCLGLFWRLGFSLGWLLWRLELCDDFWDVFWVLLDALASLWVSFSTQSRALGWVLGVFWGPWALFSAPFGCLGLPWSPVWPPMASRVEKVRFWNEKLTHFGLKMEIFLFLSAKSPKRWNSAKKSVQNESSGHDD